MRLDLKMPTSELMNCLRSNGKASVDTYTYTVTLCTHIQCAKISKNQINYKIKYTMALKRNEDGATETTTEQNYHIAYLECTS